MNGNHLQDGFTWTHEPDSLSGLSLWLKADSITGVADGGTINSWNDSSGNDNHAVQASVGLRATYRANVINGNPVVRFDGLDDYFSLTNRITDAQTIFICLLYTSPSPRDRTRSRMPSSA